MAKQLTNEQLKSIRQKLPDLKGLLEGELEYKRIFVSVFNHWLTREECTQIFTDDNDEIMSRRSQFENLVKELYCLTGIYLWRYKRRRRIFIYQPQTLRQLLSKCDIQSQHSNSGNRYDLILPEFSVVYSEEWDWTNIIWYRDGVNIKPIIEIVEKVGLHILNEKEAYKIYKSNSGSIATIGIAPETAKIVAR